MRINLCLPARGCTDITRAIYRTMKIFTFIMLVGCLHIYAGSGAQTITLSEKDAPLQKVFKKIQKQTGYEFLYRESLLKNAGNVTVNISKGTIEQVVRLCLEGKDLDFTILEKTVVIKEKEKKVSQIKNAPPIDIKGRIVNEDGEPVEASILIKGTSIGVTSNAEGYFEIKSVDDDATLVISGVSIESTEIKIAGKNTLSIVTKTKALNLNEVTVDKGYYTEKQRFSVSNVGRVTAAEIERQPINNPLLALQGRVPGLYIVQANGIPGGGLTVRIQGQNSIFYGNDPLIVVDGVPYPSQNLTTTIGGPLGASSAIQGRLIGTPGNPLSYINPSDIEAIEVLKDADATAIYGSRAANGAILITTKKGKPGETKVDINIQHGWGTVARFIDLMNNRQYLEMRREGKINDNSSISSDDYDLNGLWDTTRNTDWQKELIGGTAQYSDYNVSVSGGTNNIQYLVGGTFHTETTVFPGDFADKKAAAHFNISNVSSNQRFRFQFSGNYLADKNRLPGVDLTNGIFLAPVAPALRNADGSLNWQPETNGNSSWLNPLAQIYNLYEIKGTSLISNAVFSYTIHPTLELKSSFGYTTLTLDEFNANLITTQPPEALVNYTRSSLFSNNKTKSWIIEPQLTYKKTLGISKLEILIGSTILQRDNDGKQFIASGQPNDQQLRNFMSAATLSSVSADISTYKYNAAFGRLNLNMNEKYLVNLTARRDGSSRFGDKNKFHNFGSFGLGWIFSQEKLVQSIFPFLSFGKLRGSIGTTGSDQIPDYSTLNILVTPPNPGNPYQGVVPLVQERIPNPYLGWEETRKIQAGIDLGFVADRISFTANYVRNRSSNQLLNYNLPIITGFSQVTTNFPAVIQNSAWEFVIASQNIRSRAFKWSTSFNLTIPSNKLVEFPDLELSSYRSFLFVGKPLAVRNTTPFYGVAPQTGEFQFLDKDGKPTITPSAQDRTVFINLFPRFYGGLENSFEFNRFQLTFLVQFTKQIDANFYYNPNISAGSFDRGKGNMPPGVLARWTKPGDVSTYQRFSSNLSTFSGDRNFEDVSFARLKNLSLSYQIDESTLKRIYLRSCRIYLNAQNLFTITSYKGLDPENKNAFTLPPLRVITLGVRIGL